MVNQGTGTNRKLFPDQLSSIHPSIAGGCWFTLAERNRLYSVRVSLSRCNASTDGNGGRTTHLWKNNPSLLLVTSLAPTTQFPRSVHCRSSITSQLLVPVSRCWVVLINKQRVLEFWYLDVGVCFVECVFFSGITHAIDFQICVFRDGFWWRNLWGGENLLGTD